MLGNILFMVFDLRLRTITLAMLAALVSINCGPRLAPRLEVPAEYAGETAYRDAYTAFWWNCAIVKSVDLDARCPSTCSRTPAENAGCSAGAADAQSRIAELQTKYGPERTREILSFHIGEDNGHSQITSYFPYGPTPDKSRD